MLKHPRQCLLLCLTMVLAPFAHAETSTNPWTSLVTGQPMDFVVQAPDGPSNTARALVIYLKNLAAPRVGTESNETILQDFHAQGYLLATLDYAHHPKARVPFINRDLSKIRDDLRARKLFSQYRINPARIYIVPEGCRLKRDVVYYPDAKRTLSLDIIYPSRPAKPVGAVLEFSCDNENRYGNGSLSACSDTILDAAATEGFAVAMADHPVAPPYKGLDAMPDCAYRTKAAVRTLRAEGEALGLNGKIVPAGFSRGSGMALMLVTTDGLKEFEGRGNHKKTSSSVQGAVVLSGRFTYLDLLPKDHMIPRYNDAWGKRDSNLKTWRAHGALDYLDRPTLPLFLSINSTESPDALHQMDVLRQRLDALHSPATFMLDPEPRGHKVPLAPDVLEGMNAYLQRQLQ